MISFAMQMMSFTRKNGFILFVFEFHTSMPGTSQCGNKMNSRINFNEKQSRDYVIIRNFYYTF